MDSTELDPGGIADFVGDARSFTAEYWRKQPGVFRSTTSEWSPLTLAAVDEALESGALQSCYVDLTKAGGSAPADAYSSSRTVHQTAYPGFVDATKVRTLLDDGYTLLLRCAEQWHGPTAALTRALGAELGRHVEAFFFVTPPGQQGLPLHRDDADVLVHQVSGSKEWHVHGGPAGADWRPGPVQSDGEPLLTTVLNAGEVLYIPGASRTAPPGSAACPPTCRSPSGRSARWSSSRRCSG
ncbi:hypothetical protein E6W39_00225 [Kitasatospora acidiphila]|uniref:JmjC domain-containing protein n=1 Tax=Kitasatospora acidiphila TaxID=2567942 RepID=A0A540WG69_9ACTN|nr:cupin domain-containing protein [Kitasatospora acidiphila]TQF08023.1 hypothetical protein E6W39_00225 [Kitasatospora acidiphila]